MNASNICHHQKNLLPSKSEQLERQAPLKIRQCFMAAVKLISTLSYLVLSSWQRKYGQKKACHTSRLASSKFSWAGKRSWIWRKMMKNYIQLRGTNLLFIISMFIGLIKTFSCWCIPLSQIIFALAHLTLLPYRIQPSWLLNHN